MKAGVSPRQGHGSRANQTHGGHGGVIGGHRGVALRLLQAPRLLSDGPFLCDKACAPLALTTFGATTPVWGHMPVKTGIGIGHLEQNRGRVRSALFCVACAS